MTGQTVMAEFDAAPDTWSGRTYPEPLALEPQKERTSRRSSKRSSKSQNPALVCVCVYRTKDGQNQDATTLTMAPGVLPGVPTTPSSGECRNGGEGLLSWPISTDSQRRPFYLTMNTGEKPRVPNPTKLSQILVDSPDQKYTLSERACQGILNRAERRGKSLPPELKMALMEQAYGAGPEMQPSASKNEPVNQGGKGILLQGEHVGALSTLNNQHVFQPTGGGLTSLNSRGNGYSEEVSFTLNVVDTHGVAVDCRNGSENAEVNGTLQAKNSGCIRLNCNNVVRTNTHGR